MEFAWRGSQRGMVAQSREAEQIASLIELLSTREYNSASTTKTTRKI
jgi:hypothetical protein